MKIEYVEIKNFKAFDDFKINFRSNKNGAEKEVELDLMKFTKDNKYVIPYLNFIVGRNSIGKTTIIDAINCVAEFISNKQTSNAKIELRRQLRLDWESKEDEHFLTKEKIEKINEKIKDGEHSKELAELREKIHKREYLNFARNHNKKMQFIIKFDHKDNIMIDLTYHPFNSNEKNQLGFYEPVLSLSNSKTEIKEEIKKWSKSTIKLWKISNSKALNKIILLRRMQIQDTSYIVEILVEEFKRNQGIDDLNKLIKLANPNFIEFIDDEGSIRYTEKNSKLPLGIEKLSNGTKKYLKFLYLTLEFSKQKAGILLIDEIENFIHKELVNVVKIGIMEIASKYDLQVIITTHNPLVLKEFVSKKQIISLDDNENDEIIATKVSSKTKPKSSITNKYMNNEIAMFPEPWIAKMASKSIFAKW